MRHWLLTLICVTMTACGGDGDGGDTDAGDTDTEPVIQNLCEGIPTFDLNGATCDGILSSYSQTMSAATDCNADADCQALDARCDVNLTGTCNVIVNTCLDQSDVNVFADAYGPQCDDDGRTGCPQGGCPPLDYGCDDNKCVFRLTY